MFFKKPNKNIKTIRQSFDSYLDQMDSTAAEGILEKHKDFEKSSLELKAICDRIEKIIPEENQDLVFALQVAASAITRSGSQMYKKGFRDCMEYVKFAIDKELYKNIKE